MNKENFNNFDLLNINDVYNNGFTIEYLDILSILAIFTSILVITNKNPVVSVLFLIGLFLSISVYLILIGLTFIGISYLLVYIGAVSMLFLFILMLIDIRISELHEETTNSLSLAFIMGILFYYITNKNIVGGVLSKDSTLTLIFNDNMNSPLSNSWDVHLIEAYDVITIGNVLYTNFSLWLIISSLILLLAMVGAIIINIKPGK